MESGERIPFIYHTTLIAHAPLSWKPIWCKQLNSIPEGFWFLWNWTTFDLRVIFSIFPLMLQIEDTDAIKLRPVIYIISHFKFCKWFYSAAFSLYFSKPLLSRTVLFSSFWEKKGNKKINNYWCPGNILLFLLLFLSSV